MPRRKDANGKEIRNGKKRGDRSGASKRMTTATSGTGKKFAYVFTCNNYSDDEVFLIANAVHFYEEIIYVDFGFEVGESGTPHLQGQIEMSIECM